MPNPDIKDPLVPQQDNSVFDSIPKRPWREELKFKQPASITEPVATLPACLCGLDTNPVASPRMDVHCPKHDAPKVGGEPELVPSERRDLGGAITNALEMPDSIWVSPPLDEKGTRSWGGYHMRKDDVRFTCVSQPALQVEGAPPDGGEAGQCECACHVAPIPCSQCGCVGIFEPGAESADKIVDINAQTLPTPAGEEVARALVDAVNEEFDVTPSGDDSCWAEYDRGLVARISTALAQARRAGTPTTDARAKSVVDHLFTILARDYNIELTNNDASELTETVASALSSTPSKQKENEDV